MLGEKTNLFVADIRLLKSYIVKAGLLCVLDALIV